MKSKILSSLSLFICLALVNTTMKSDKNGNTSSGGTSCFSCHGSANAATSVALTGLPTTFITGQTYNLSLVISNSTLTKYGCNVKCSAGTFTAGSGNKVSGGQITHISPSTSNTFSFTWTAPATTSAVTFSYVGNAVNGDNNATSADQWNLGTSTVPGSFPASVTDVNTQFLKCYPNPATSNVTIEGLSSDAKNIRLFNLFGQSFTPSYSFNGNNVILNCEALATGTYFIYANANNKNVKATFVKQ